MRTFQEYITEVRIVLGGGKKPVGYVDRPAALVTVFNSKGTKSGNGTRIRIGGTSVYVELISFNESVHITEISIPHDKQGQGIGHKVMKMLTDMADKFKVKLDLSASPISQAPGESKIPTAKLVKFYKEHGFSGPAGRMHREPK